MSDLEEEVFLVMQNRMTDSALPSAAKTCGNAGAEMFFTPEDAEQFKNKLGAGFGVYRALIRVTLRVS